MAIQNKMKTSVFKRGVTLLTLLTDIDLVNTPLYLRNLIRQRKILLNEKTLNFSKDYRRKVTLFDFDENDQMSISLVGNCTYNLFIDGEYVRIDRDIYEETRVSISDGEILDFLLKKYKLNKKVVINQIKRKKEKEEQKRRRELK